MRLDPRWKEILKRAWSIKLIILAGVLTGAEFLLPFFDGVFPRGIFAALSFAVVCAAFVARIVAQKGL